MKKIVALLFGLCIMSFSQMVFAYNPYPQYLNGDTNYVLCYGHMGVGEYLNKKSISIDLYDPPHYRLSGDIVYVNDADQGNTSIYSTVRLYFDYNIDSNTVYTYNKNDGQWHWLDTNHIYGYNSLDYQSANEMFKAIYNMNFYNY